MVYVFQMGLAGPLKIGFSTNVGQRLETIQHHSPFDMHRLVAFEGTVEDEAALHRRFAKFRMRGEWFLPASEIIDYCIERDPMYRSKCRRREKVWDIYSAAEKIDQYRMLGPTTEDGG